MTKEIEEQLEIIEWALEKRKITLNTSEVAKIIGVSSSTIDNWREEGCGIEYLKPYDDCMQEKGGNTSGIKNLNTNTNFKEDKKGKKSKSRVLYPTLNVAKWLIKKPVKTA